MSVIPDWAYENVDSRVLYPAVLVPCPPTGELIDMGTCARRNKKPVNPNDTGSNTDRPIAVTVPIRDTVGIEEIRMIRRELELELADFEREFPGVSTPKTFSEWKAFIKTTGQSAPFFDAITSASMLGLKETQKVGFVEFMTRVHSVNARVPLPTIETEEKTDLTPILVLGGVILLFVVTR